MKLRVSLWMPALLCVLLVAPVGVFVPAVASASSHSSADQHASANSRIVHLHMQNVLFSVMKDVVLQVDSLDGVLAPSQKTK